jgi:hypothetical protein
MLALGAGFCFATLLWLTVADQNLCMPLSVPMAATFGVVSIVAGFLLWVWALTERFEHKESPSARMIRLMSQGAK